MTSARVSSSVRAVFLTWQVLLAGSSIVCHAHEGGDCFHRYSEESSPASPAPVDLLDPMTWHCHWLVFGWEIGGSFEEEGCDPDRDAAHPHAAVDQAPDALTVDLAAEPVLDVFATVVPDRVEVQPPLDERPPSPLPGLPSAVISRSPVLLT